MVLFYGYHWTIDREMTDLQLELVYWWWLDCDCAAWPTPRQRHLYLQTGTKMTPRVDEYNWQIQMTLRPLHTDSSLAQVLPNCTASVQQNSRKSDSTGTANFNPTKAIIRRILAPIMYWILSVVKSMSYINLMHCSWMLRHRTAQNVYVHIWVRLFGFRSISFFSDWSHPVLLSNVYSLLDRVVVLDIR